MIRIYSGDLVAVEFDERFYYAIVLDPIKLFGGNFVYALHRTSRELLTSEAILSGPANGFHAFVDFIFAKREDRLTRVAKKIDTSAFECVTHFKRTVTLKGKAKFWFIVDRDLDDVGRVETLTNEQKAFPLVCRIDDSIMVSLVNEKYVPEDDPRI